MYDWKALLSFTSNLVWNEVPVIYSYNPVTWTIEENINFMINNNVVSVIWSILVTNTYASHNLVTLDLSLL